MSTPNWPPSDPPGPYGEPGPPPAGPPGGWQPEPVGPPPGPPGWQPDPYGAPPPISGQFGPPPQKSGPPTGIIVAIIVLVVAAVGGLAFFLTSGDDDETSTQDTSETTQPGDVTTLPTDDLPGTTEATLPGDGGDLPSDDVVLAAAEWVYTNTPGSVDEGESACMAGVVIGVVGEDRVAAADGDMSSVYAQTSLDEDAAIREAYPSCLDAESVADMATDAGSWPWP